VPHASSPSIDFLLGVAGTTLERKRPMSRRGVEIVIERLVVEEAIRRRFTRTPNETLDRLLELGLDRDEATGNP
jgi:hypothetical protein